MAEMETRSLLCPLSEEDFKLRAHNLAVARQKAREVEAAKKAAAARFATELKDLNEEIDRLAGIVKAKAEHRPVLVEWIKEQKTGTMRLIRLDTETEIDSRPMTVAERQATLDFSKKAAAKEETKPKKNGKANGHKAPATTEATPA